MKQVNNQLVEKIAAIQHEIWAHWMNYLFRVGKKQADGSVVIPKDLVDRWCRQMVTAYNELTNEEKKSDKDQADIIVNIFNKSDKD